jgi:hypothetical protein
MEHLTLKRLTERASREEASFTSDPGRYVKKKALGMGISIGVPLHLRRTWNLEGGSYTGGL